MKLCCLGTGSKANCTVISHAGKSILIDAGYKYREFLKRSALVGLDVHSIQGIFLSHDHRDHCAGAVEIATTLRIPIFATKGTLDDLCENPKAARVEKIELHPLESVSIAGLAVQPLPVPHDAKEPVAFLVFSNDGEVAAVCLDLGSIPDELAASLRCANTLVLDCNHSSLMLRNAPYAPALKNRISSEKGHLSNVQVAHFLQGSQFRNVILAHLSQNANSPLAVLADIQNYCGDDFKLAPTLSLQNEPTGWI